MAVLLIVQPRFCYNFVCTHLRSQSEFFCNPQFSPDGTPGVTESAMVPVGSGGDSSIRISVGKLGSKSSDYVKMKLGVVRLVKVHR